MSCFFAFVWCVPKGIARAPHTRHPLKLSSPSRFVDFLELVERLEVRRLVRSQLVRSWLVRSRLVRRKTKTSTGTKSTGCRCT